jgi:hypothetical protein
MLRQYLRSMLRSRTTLAAFILLTAYWLIGIVLPNTLALTDPQLNPKITDANYYGFFSCYSATFILIPVFIILLQYNRSFFNSVYVIARSNKYLKISCFRLAAICAECALTILYIYALILARQIYFKPIGIETMLPHFLECMVLQFLGLACIALIYSIVCSIFGNGLSGFLCCIILSVYDFTASSGKGASAIFIARTIYCKYQTLTLLNTVITVFYMVLIIAALFVVGNNTLSEKEYLK